MVLDRFAALILGLFGVVMLAIGRFFGGDLNWQGNLLTWLGIALVGVCLAYFVAGANLHFWLLVGGLVLVALAWIVGGGVSAVLLPGALLVLLSVLLMARLLTVDTVSTA